MRLIYLIILSCFCFSAFGQIKPANFRPVPTGQAGVYFLTDGAGKYQEVYKDTVYCLGADLYTLFRSTFTDALIHTETITGGCSPQEYVADVTEDSIYLINQCSLIAFNLTGEGDSIHADVPCDFGTSTYHIVSQPLLGFLTLNTDGTGSYVPYLSQPLTDTTSFRYAVHCNDVPTDTAEVLIIGSSIICEIAVDTAGLNITFNQAFDSGLDSITVFNNDGTLLGSFVDTDSARVVYNYYERCDTSFFEVDGQVVYWTEEHMDTTCIENEVNYIFYKTDSDGTICENDTICTAKKCDMAECNIFTLNSFDISKTGNTGNSPDDIDITIDVSVDGAAPTVLNCITGTIYLNDPTTGTAQGTPISVDCPWGDVACWSALDWAGIGLTKFNTATPLDASNISFAGSVLSILDASKNDRQLHNTDGDPPEPFNPDLAYDIVFDLLISNCDLQAGCTNTGVIVNNTLDRFFISTTDNSSNETGLTTYNHPLWGLLRQYNVTLDVGYVLFASLDPSLVWDDHIARAAPNLYNNLTLQIIESTVICDGIEQYSLNQSCQYVNPDVDMVGGLDAQWDALADAVACRSSTPTSSADWNSGSLLYGVRGLDVPAINPFTGNQYRRQRWFGTVNCDECHLVSVTFRVEDDGSGDPSIGSIVVFGFSNYIR